MSSKQTGTGLESLEMASVREFDKLLEVLSCLNSLLPMFQPVNVMDDRLMMIRLFLAFVWRIINLSIQLSLGLPFPEPLDNHKDGNGDEKA